MSGLTIYTIGHSNHDIGHFIGLLTDNGIESVVDVRSAPYSKFAPQFNKDNIERSLREKGIGYLFLGDLIGGRPKEDEYYDDEGYVLYDRYARSAGFTKGIVRLMEVAEGSRVAIMCGEVHPTACHRHQLIAPVLVEHSVTVKHILGDGGVVDYSEVSGHTGTEGQADIFSQGEVKSWRSTRSVLPRRRRKSSSGR